MVRTAGDAEWDAFVVSAWPGLVRTATLLTADPGAAAALAATALARTPRRSQAAAGVAGRAAWQERARRELLMLPAGPGPRLRARIRGIRGDRPDEPDEPDEPESVLARYRLLGARRRALLVLTVADGLDIAAAGAVLGLPAPLAEHEVTAAVDALRVASSDGLVELELGDLPSEEAGGPGVDALFAADPAVLRLREDFARLAAAFPVADDPLRRVDRALVVNGRSRRHRVLGGACVSAAAVVCTAGVVRAQAGAEAERLQLAREQAVYASQHPPVLDGDLTTWRTRGSLGRDPQVLGGLRARVASRPTVLFAGDVVGVDVAVAVTRAAGGTTLVHVLAGPPGTPLDRWRETGGELLDGPGGVPAVSAAVRDEEGRLHVLLVTLTAGVTASYSSAPVLADDAGVSRRFVRLPLTDGIGAALVDGSSGGLRLRIEGGGGAAILLPLVVTSPDDAAGATPPLQLPVTRPPSCRGSREAGDVPGLVQEGTRDAGLSGSDITAVRLLWCRRDSIQGEAALALSARSGPDIQCYELGEAGAGGSYESFRQCWPVPRGAGASTPFLAPAFPFSDRKEKELPVTIHAPGAAYAELQAAPAGSPTVARARVAPDGYGRFVATGTRARPEDVLQREGAITFRDGSGHMISILLVSRNHPSDVWGEGAGGPVREP